MDTTTLNSVTFYCENEKKKPSSNLSCVTTCVYFSSIMNLSLIDKSQLECHFCVCQKDTGEVSEESMCFSTYLLCHLHIKAGKKWKQNSVLKCAISCMYRAITSLSGSETMYSI